MKGRAISADRELSGSISKKETGASLKEKKRSRASLSER